LTQQAGDQSKTVLNFLLLLSAVLFLLVAASGIVGVLLWTQLRSGSISVTSDTPDSKHAASHDSICERAKCALASLDGSVPTESLGEISESFRRRAGLCRRVFSNNDLARTLGLIDAAKASTGGGESAAIGTLTSLAIEKDRLDALRVGDRVVQRWLFVHVSAVACLLGLGSMHGVTTHAHGMLAHLLLKK